MCCCYWPWQGGTNVHGEIEVKYFGGSATKHYTVRYMEVTDIKVSYYANTSAITSLLHWDNYNIMYINANMILLNKYLPHHVCIISE